MPQEAVVPLPSASLVAESGVPELLGRIRPAWQAKNLIVRVKRLLPVDPSSACQRLFNAAMHDLREKVVVAGVDIAKEAARANKLPVPDSDEDVLERYPTSKLIELAHRMGLLSRPECRRISRCYEIRKDLEHEDDEYEAGVEDCEYIFRTCIDAILASDPVRLIRVDDVKELVQQPNPAFPSEELKDDYGRAPHSRQEDICRFLISICLDGKQADLVRQNAFTFLQQLQRLTHNQVRLKLAEHIQGRVDRRGLDRLHARVAFSCGVTPYLKQAMLRDLFSAIFRQMEKVGSRWGGYNEHGELLRSFQEVGGLSSCPDSVRGDVLRWLVKTYIGKPGGTTRYGHVRHVFYSDTAAPLIEEIVVASKAAIADDLERLRDDRSIARELFDEHVSRRYEKLLDLVRASD